jgi:hypothetical protein
MTDWRRPAMQKTTRKAIKHGTDARGRKLALVDNGDATFTLLVKCANYAAHVRGGIAHTWRYIGCERMARADAEAVFARRNKTA